MAIGKAK